MDEALIRYKNVYINQQELGVLEDVNLELNKGEFVYLIGKVGSGKTSLLKTIYGELDIQSGEAEVLGYNMTNIKRKHIPELRRRLGIVFQDFQLLTDRTVHANLSFVLRATGWTNKATIKARIEEVLDQVGMTGKGYKMPNELSGGEQQRIVIARAILPKMIFISCSRRGRTAHKRFNNRTVDKIAEIDTDSARTKRTIVRKVETTETNGLDFCAVKAGGN